MKKQDKWSKADLATHKGCSIHYTCKAKGGGGVEKKFATKINELKFEMVSDDLTSMLFQSY